MRAWFSGRQFIVEDMNTDVRPGDEIRRPLPNGRGEVFAVEDPTCYASGAFEPHYQIKVSRQRTMDRHSGGNYAIHVSGANARVNLNSTDNSTDVSNSGTLFVDIRAALAAGVLDPESRDSLLAAVDEMEAAKDDPSKLAQAFEAFVALAAKTMTIITPFCHNSRRCWLPDVAGTRRIESWTQALVEHVRLYKDPPRHDH